jgi:poly [ADP-ribose] polymerase
MDRQPKYLVKVEPGANNNKFYRMIPNDDGTWTAEYGRIGMPNFQTETYPMSKWDAKYKEKTSDRKGYVDQTHLVAETITVIKKKSGYADIPDKFIADIVLRLQQMAKMAIQENYTIQSTAVTKAMIEEAQRLLNSLGNSKTVDDFNVVLVELFKTIPRKMKKVADYLAFSDKDFARIVEREQDLFDVMSTQVRQNQIENNEQDIVDEEEVQTTILDAMGLMFERCTDADIAKIKKELGELADLFVQAWKVTNKKTQKKFDEFVATNNIKDVRLLFHGSRNENWWSIITTGLLLKPNAVITGKMFGNGIYFAPRSRKSYGYCSGGYWTGGSASHKFMALNLVAYGTPYVVYDFNSKFYSLNYNSLQSCMSGANCLHTKADKGMLRNDEIIVYKEEQVTVKYLIELK